MNPEERRALLLKHVKRMERSWYSSEIESVVCDEAKDHSEEFRLVIREEIWRLISQGILVPGLPNHDHPNSGFPHLRITEYGKVVLSDQEFNPYNGFSEYARCLLEKLRSTPRLKMAAIDETVLRYIFEAIQVFQHHSWNSAAVMLGVATERCLHMIADCIGRCRAETASRFKLGKTSTRTAEYRAQLNKALQSIGLDTELEKNRELYLGSLFDNIMWSRNAAGHPKIVNVDRYEIFVHLQLFQTYFIWIYQVISHLSPQDQLLNPGLFGKETTDSPL